MFPRDNIRKTFTDMHSRVFEHSNTLSFALLACIDLYILLPYSLAYFYAIAIFEVVINNLSLGFYSTCTLVFWLPNLDKFD